MTLHQPIPVVSAISSRAYVNTVLNTNITPPAGVILPSLQARPALSIIRPELYGLLVGGGVAFAICMYALATHDTDLATVMSAPVFASLLGCGIVVIGLRRRRPTQSNSVVPHDTKRSGSSTVRIISTMAG